jgi:hypothetical protein
MSKNFFKIDPAGSYLLDGTKDKPTGQASPTPPSTLNLADLGVKAGDLIRIGKSGDYRAGTNDTFQDDGDSLVAVFVDASGNYLSPSSYRPKKTDTQFSGKITDITNDFEINTDFGSGVRVPPGAVALKFSVEDVYYSDNTDPDNDFGATIATGNDALVNGSEVVLWFDRIRSETSQDNNPPPFVKLVDISAASTETWSNAEYLMTPTASYSSTSNAGSKISLKESSTESSGGNKSSLDLGFSNNAGDKLSLLFSASDQSTTTSSKGSQKLSFSWNYLGSASTSQDDLSIEVITENNRTQSKNSTGIKTTSGSKYDVRYKSANATGISLSVKATLNDERNYDKNWQETSTNRLSTVTQFAYSDPITKFKFSFTGNAVTNDKTGSDQFELNFKNIVSELDGIKIQTAKYVGLVSNDNGPFNLQLDSIDTMTEKLSTGLAVLILDGDNSITGSSGSDLIEGSSGNDTIDGGTGDDIFDISAAPWTLDNWGSDFKVTGTTSNFNIQYLSPDDGKLKKINIKNIEEVQMSDGIYSVAKFINPFTASLNGEDFIGIMKDLASNGESISSDFGDQLDITDYQTLNWNDQEYNPIKYAGKNNLKYKAVDSNDKTIATANFISDSTGDTSTSNKSSGNFGLTVTGSEFAGDSFGFKWSLSISKTLDKQGNQTAAKFIGSTSISQQAGRGTESKTDDINLSEISSGSYSETNSATSSSNEFNGSKKYVLIDYQAGIELKADLAAKSSYVEKNGIASTNKEIISLKNYSLKVTDTGGKVLEFLKLSGSVNINYAENQKDTGENYQLSNIEYGDNDSTIKTSKLSVFEQLDSEGLNLGLNSGSDLTKVVYQFKNESSWFDKMLSSDNLITVVNTSGAAVLGGAGKDTINGASGTDVIDGGIGDDKIDGKEGNDTLSGGGGLDLLKGGTGNDTFILNFSEFIFSSSSNLKATIIADFKFSTSGEQDTLMLNGFAGIFRAFSTLSDAKSKLAAETQKITVIYENTTGKLWYNEDGDAELVGIMNFAVAKDIPNNYWSSFQMS